MYQVEVTITVRKQDTYGSNSYATSRRETLSTGDTLDSTVAEVTDQCRDDVFTQTLLRRQAESAASE